MLKRTRSTWGLLLAAACAMLACEGEPSVEITPERPVLVTAVEVVDLEERIEATGELLAKYHADVAAQVPGEITEILADEGDAVAEDQVVVEIDPERRHLELDRAKARVGEAQAAVAEQRREMKRVEALAERHVASQTKLDQAGTALQAARSRLRAAEAELGVSERALRDASVRARFAGVIAKRHVSRGEFVRAGQSLFELVSLDPIEVEFHLPEADSSRVRENIPIEVTVTPYPGEVFDATVTVVSPTIDARTRTLRVKALLQNPEGRLRPGLFARANLGIARREGVIMVPEEAVLQRADGSIVFRIVDGNRVERRRVETGVTRDGRMEVRAGLEASDRVVSRGHADLIDGAVVVSRNADGSLARAAAGETATDPVATGEVVTR